MITKSIRDIMNRNATVGISPQTTLAEALEYMAQNDMTDTVVLTDGVVQGMLSECDMIRHVSQHGGIDTTPVADVMTKDVRFIETRDSISEALSRMLSDGHRHLPVLDMGRAFIGVLSTDDIPDEFHKMHRRYDAWKTANGGQVQAA